MEIAAAGGSSIEHFGLKTLFGVLCACVRLTIVGANVAIQLVFHLALCLVVMPLWEDCLLGSPFVRLRRHLRARLALNVRHDTGPPPLGTCRKSDRELKSSLFHIVVSMRFLPARACVVFLGTDTVQKHLSMTMRPGRSVVGGCRRPTRTRYLTGEFRRHRNTSASSGGPRQQFTSGP